MSQACIRLTPERLAFDRQPQVVLEGLGARQQVRLTATMVDGTGSHYSSEATFLTDPEGRVDLDNEPPMGGTYFGLCPQGLFWSLGGERRLFEQRDLEPLTMELRLEVEGEVVDQKALQRYFLEDSVQHQPLQEGGDLFSPAGAKLQVLLLNSGLFGSSRAGAALLANHGYRVASYTLPRTQPLALETVMQALQGLRQSGLATVLCGSGRGAELALLLAPRLELDGLICFSGSGLAFPGWTVGDEPLPATELDPTLVVPREPLSTRKMYAEAVVDRDNRDRGRIKVERIGCPIRLFSGGDDQVWPASAFSELVFQRCQKLAPQTDCVHKTFPEAGHCLGPELGFPHQPTTDLTFLDPAVNLMRQTGGNASHQAHAQRESWKAMLQFLATLARDS